MLRFIEHFFCGSRYWFSGTKICGCFWEIGNSYGSNGKAPKSSARRSFLWRIYGYLLRVRQVLPYNLIQRKTGEGSLGVLWRTVLSTECYLFKKRQHTSTTNRRKRPKRDSLQIRRFPSFSATIAEGLVKSYGFYSSGNYLLRFEVLNENLLSIWKGRYLSKSLVVFRDSVTLK